MTDICQRAAKNAIRESVNFGIARARQITEGLIDEDEPFEDPVPFIRRDHFEEAMSRARRSVSDADIRKYEEYTSKMKSDAAAAGAGGFSFEKPAEEAVEGEEAAEKDEDLY